MFSGDFEVHLTGAAQEADALAAFASRRGAKFTHILLNHGDTPSQPMLTVRGSGTLADLHRLADGWRADLAAKGLRVLRVKIEAAPWNEGVPESDLDASDELYFEHHVKVLLPSDDTHAVDQLRWAIVENGANVSRNARRRRGRHEERFVTQRCRGVGRATARTRLDALLAVLRDGGYEVVEVEEEYVVHDDALHVDNGWLDPTRWGDRNSVRDDLFGSGPSRGHTPSTFRPLAGAGRDVRQHRVFDPALKHFDDAYRAGEPVFGDPAEGARWSAARRAAMAHVLAVVAASPWAENLVLRGSVALRAWLGEVAREPGDLDFVVAPKTFAPDGPEARAMLAGPGGGRRRRSRSGTARRPGGGRAHLDLRAGAGPAADVPVRRRRPATGRGAGGPGVQRGPARRAGRRRGPTTGHADARRVARPVTGLEDPVAGDRHVPTGEGPVRRRAARRAHPGVAGPRP
jgi:hypothetical protein